MTCDVLECTHFHHLPHATIATGGSKTNFDSCGDDDDDDDDDDDADDDDDDDEQYVSL